MSGWDSGRRMAAAARSAERRRASKKQARMRIPRSAQARIPIPHLVCGCIPESHPDIIEIGAALGRLVDGVDAWHVVHREHQRRRHCGHTEPHARPEFHEVSPKLAFVVAGYVTVPENLETHIAERVRRESDAIL